MPMRHEEAERFRKQIRAAVPCPQCLAPPGANCRRKNGEVRVRNHAARGRLWKALSPGSVTVR